MQIHELPEAASVADTDQIAIDTGTNTKKFTILGLLRKIIGTTSISGIGDGTVTGAISALNAGARYAPGDAVSFNNLFTPGRLVNARNRAYFCIQLPKPITATGFSVTFSAANFWMSDGVHAVGSLTDVQNKSVLGAAGTVLMTLPLSAAASVAGSCTCELSGTITFN